MRNKIAIMGSIFLLLTIVFSCNLGKRATNEGIDSLAYLHFVMDEKPSKDVNWTIIIDEGGQTPITVDKNNPRFSKDNLYSIPPGTHHLKVYKDEVLVLSQKLFVSSRETKTIKL